ncbi:hypothetical protein BCR39DRAFT_383077 [Naematelia encephala]|uniref:Uncharacterized protein n=1 Tax=Naematelia encephala TaxID=71784 RepID=A0A1Y2AIV9_9TREE|nr:hypothetical protein BCR39DRAFT_383077 [Naematelia encephala]
MSDACLLYSTPDAALAGSPTQRCSASLPVHAALGSRHMNYEFRLRKRIHIYHSAEILSSSEGCTRALEYIPVSYTHASGSFLSFFPSIPACFTLKLYCGIPGYVIPFFFVAGRKREDRDFLRTNDDDEADMN